MVATTNVPQITFSVLGVTIPTPQAVLEGVIADFKVAFGTGLNLSADDPTTLATPQGQLASSMAAIINNVYQNFLYQSTQTDPAYAQGRWQDAIARIYFLERNPAEPTVIQVLCTGLVNTVIPVNSTVSDDTGNIYVATVEGIIPVGGSVTIPFACTIPGPTACPANSVAIYQAIPGWDSATNLDDGVIGNNIESRSEFENRRAASVAANSVGAVSSIIGSVLSVPNVLDAYVTENATNAPVTIGGYTLIANSLYVAVVGGDEDAVARAIWEKKAPGCSYNGNTTVAVEDSNSGYTEPFPEYTVKFETPAALPILFSVNILNGATVPADAVTQIQNAIINAFAGGDDGPRARIGGTVLASRFYVPVLSLGTWAQIVSLDVGSSNDAGTVTFGASIVGTAMTVNQVVSGTLAIGQTISDDAGLISPGTKIVSGSALAWVLSKTHTIPGASLTGTGAGTNLTASAVTGTILVGMLLNGTGVPANTRIVSQSSGTIGGAGVYVTSNATTSVAAAITAKKVLLAALPNKNSTSVEIDQVPTVSADNIAISLT